ncbi:MAG: hypothetical protein ACRCZP_16725, partial [Phycicoccus sp.]
IDDRDATITGHTTRIADLEARLRARPEPVSAAAAPLSSAVPAVAEPEVAPPAEPEHAPAAEPEVAPAAEAEATPDVAAGSAALGVSLKADDLTAVEGIGPKIRDLIHATGVRTWRALSLTDVAALQQMLDAAGPRYRVHNPGTWPRQAGLLADGRWDEFKQLTASLRGGRTV